MKDVCLSSVLSSGNSPDELGSVPVKRTHIFFTICYVTDRINIILTNSRSSLKCHVLMCPYSP